MMKQAVLSRSYGNGLGARLSMYGASFPRRIVIGAILVIALLAFELFNFDTTRFALTNLIGQVTFLGFGWATILAIAFCAIDFAGLVRMFTPDKDGGEPREVWFLMGAWLLGATMNALMTWWAVSLTLLSHDFGNEVLSRSQLLQIVPVFVAVLVWLTRILFIGALTVAGEHLMEFGIQEQQTTRIWRANRAANRTPLGQRQARPALSGPHQAPAPHPFPHVSNDLPQFLQERGSLDARPGIRPVPEDEDLEPVRATRDENINQQRGDQNSVSASASAAPRANGRVRQRPPRPGSRSSKSISARPRGRN